MCRKTLADSRPRVRGRFARNDDSAAVMPHETKKALAEKARKEKKANGKLQRLLGLVHAWTKPTCFLMPLRRQRREVRPNGNVAFGGLGSA